MSKIIVTQQILIGALFLIFISACGSGSSNKAEVETEVEKRPAPDGYFSVSETVPANQSVDIPEDSEIRLVFEKNLQAQSNWEQALEVKTAEGVVSGEWQLHNSNELVFRAAEQLPAAHLINVAVSGDIRSVDNHQLKLDSQIRFSVAVGALQTLSDVRPVPYGAPKLAFDSQGNALAVWVKNESSSPKVFSHIYYSFYDSNSKTWSQEAYFRIVFAKAEKLKLQAGSDFFVVAWRADGAINTKIFNSVSAEWGETIAFTELLYNDNFQLHTRLDDYMVTWYRERGAIQSGYVEHPTSEVARKETSVPGKSPYQNRQRDDFTRLIAFNQRYYVSWIAEDGTTYKINLSEYDTATGFWSQPTEIFSSPSYIFNLAVAANQSKILFSWAHVDEAKDVILNSVIAMSNNEGLSANLQTLHSVASGRNLGFNSIIQAPQQQVLAHDVGFSMVWENGSVVAMRFNGSAWSDVSVIETDEKPLRLQAVSRDADDIIISTGASLEATFASSGYPIVATRFYRFSEGAWQSEGLLPNDFSESTFTDLATVDNKTFVIWHQLDENQQSNIAVSQLASERNPEFLVQNSHPSRAHLGDAVSTTNGHVTIVWSQKINQASVKLFRTYDGNSWLPIMPVSDNPTSNSSAVRLMAHEKQMFLMWTEGRNLAYRKYSEGQAWSDVFTTPDVQRTYIRRNAVRYGDGPIFVVPYMLDRDTEYVSVFDVTNGKYVSELGIDANTGKRLIFIKKIDDEYVAVWGAVSEYVFTDFWISRTQTDGVSKVKTWRELEHVATNLNEYQIGGFSYQRTAMHEAFLWQSRIDPPAGKQYAFKKMIASIDRSQENPTWTIVTDIAPPQATRLPLAKLYSYMDQIYLFWQDEVAEHEMFLKSAKLKVLQNGAELVEENQFALPYYLTSEVTIKQSGEQWIANWRSVKERIIPLDPSDHYGMTFTPNDFGLPVKFPAVASRSIDSFMVLKGHRLFNITNDRSNQTPFYGQWVINGQ